MFGFGKQNRLRRLSEDIGAKLRNVLAFPRHMNDGKVPESLKKNNYVLGYHAREHDVGEGDIFLVSEDVTRVCTVFFRQ